CRVGSGGALDAAAPLAAGCSCGAVDRAGGGAPRGRLFAALLRPGAPASVTTMQLENGEVSLAGVGGVAVREWAMGTASPTTIWTRPRPVAFVVRDTVPRNFSPSPNPEGSQAALLKRSMAKVVLGVLTSATRAVVLPSPETAVFTDGAPWPLLPPPAREIPRPALAKMAFRRTALPPPTST